MMEGVRTPQILTLTGTFKLAGEVFGGFWGSPRRHPMPILGQKSIAVQQLALPGG
jgi:hypothetical protein